MIKKPRIRKKSSVFNTAFKVAVNLFKGSHRFLRQICSAGGYAYVNKVS